jgi:hypothetical protein
MSLKTRVTRPSVRKMKNKAGVIIKTVRVKGSTAILHRMPKKR